MRGFGLLNLARFAALFALAFAARGAAATLTPSALGGSYSSSYNAPTLVGAGYTEVDGIANPGQTIDLAFTALPAGAQTLSFTFSLPATVGVQGPANHWAYVNGGGTALYSTSPFAFDWAGSYLGTFGVANYSASAMTDTLTLSLGSAFSGTLYLGLHFTFGSPLNFSISAPSNALAAAGSTNPVSSISPVPLPPGLLLLAGGLALLVLVPRGRRLVG